MSEPFIVHSHIPKTGGSALNRRLLFPLYGEDRAYQMYRYVFETASRLPRRHVARAMRSYVAVGHVPFGYFDEVYPQAIYVSVFREPVARFVSFLNFVLANAEHAVRQRIDEPVIDNAADDPDRFIAAVLAEPRLAIVHQNAQTRLAGGSPRLGQCPVTGDHLDAALRNVARECYVTGIQEDMVGLIARFRERFPTARFQDAGSPHLEKRMTRALAVQHLGARTLDRLRAANDLDLYLYDAVHKDRQHTLRQAA